MFPVGKFFPEISAGLLNPIFRLPGRGVGRTDTKTLMGLSIPGTITGAA